jgi:CBS domain-containing protein
VLAAVVGYLAGLWAAIVGTFLGAAAAADQPQVELSEARDGVSAGELMSAPALELPAELPLAEVRQAARRHRFASLPVVDRDGEAVGLLPGARHRVARRDRGRGGSARSGPAART